MKMTRFALISGATLSLALAGCSQYATVSEKCPSRLPLPAGSGALLTLAEQTIAKALRKDDHNPLAAIGEYLDAAEIASRQLKSSPNDAIARRDYNFAISRVFSTLRAEKIPAWGGEPLRVTGANGEWQISGRTDITREPILPLLEFIPADQIQLGGTYVQQRETKAGIGAPLIATLRDATAFLKRDPFAQGKNIYYGVTAVARFEGRRCIISFEDPLAKETVPFAGHTQPLAADFTAPLALMLARENPKKIELARLLRPGKYAETARLARLQVYDPAKIPVLCVHGLMDSQATWAPMLNALRADPDIRKRYQFWFYSHPSGYPYPHSAAIFRKQLNAINSHHPGHKKIVLIGHSMGGMISRLMLTDSGDKLWLKMFNKPPGETQLTANSRQLLTDALIFKHREDVGRAIFIAAPHRGSDLASNWLARFGSSIIKSPNTLLSIGNDVLKVTTFQSGDLHLKKIPNSVDTLAPNNRFVKEVNTIPITRAIPYHSIIGDRGKGGNKDRTKPICSDGFVPYWSSHVEGAQSELIVPSGHSAHQNPQAIAEVKRILMLNATR
jgi:triacylglycerol esterase/lipase EstA (alpha/beta hydrolase family)